jgi:enoyl-[acyl-carrier protein] reductase I
MKGSKVGIVFGVANQRSIAWSSALALMNYANFDHVIVTYQNDRNKASVEKLVQDQNYNWKKSPSPKSMTCLPCDVSVDDDVRLLFSERIPQSISSMQVENNWTCDHPDLVIDALVHSVAFAPADAMKGNDSLPFLNTSRDAFVLSHVISAYSLLTVSKYALNYLCPNFLIGDSATSIQRKRSPSITAVSYIGSTRAVRNYNIMGPAKASLEAIIRGLALELGPEPYSIRVNGVSSGPINTLAARGIQGFVEMKQDAAKRSCLNRNATAAEVGSLVAFLADEDRSSGITGQILFCDSGFSSVAM